MESSCSIDGCALPASSRGWCSKHYTRWLRHGDPLFITRNPPSTENAAEKRCPRCNTVRPIEDFGRRPNGKPKGYCRQCEARYQRDYAKSDSGKDAHRKASAKWHGANGRDYQLAYRYGLSEDDYDRMYEQQAGKCAICGTQSANRLHVDHCHDTLNVRGLLCSKCNIGLGYFNDRPDLLRRAADYCRTE